MAVPCWRPSESRYVTLLAASAFASNTAIAAAITIFVLFMSHLTFLPMSSIIAEQVQNCANPDNNISLTPKNPAILKKDVISCRNWHSFQDPSASAPSASKSPQLGGATSPLPATPSRNRTKRQNQAIRKNSTIPQSNFHSSWGPTPKVPKFLTPDVHRHLHRHP